MSPSMPSHTATSQYITPTSDVRDRHEYGVQKHSKPASTGGGRAWSEDEEVYLLQTRLQKMPYKHIASHLKKTELACRLHYHQLSHGSNRRKRMTSVSSGSSLPSESPVLATISRMPSPVQEAQNSGTSYSFSYSPVSSQVQLPSLQSISGSTSPQQRTLAAILPKPSLPRRPLSESAQPLRLDCAAHPPAGPTTMTVSRDVPAIDAVRLAHIYETHRAQFWSTIAADYGMGATPTQLEHAWRQGGAVAPPTPCVSPDSSWSYRDEKQPYVEKESKAISVSALLGIDASPRSPRRGN